MVTHDPVAASHADRAVFLADGGIVADLPQPRADTVLEWMTSVERTGELRRRDDRHSSRQPAQRRRP